MWYNRVVKDLGELPAFIAYYEAELEKARKDAKISGIIEINLKEYRLL